MARGSSSTDQSGRTLVSRIRRTQASRTPGSALTAGKICGWLAGITNSGNGSPAVKKLCSGQPMPSGRATRRRDAQARPALRGVARGPQGPHGQRHGQQRGLLDPGAEAEQEADAERLCQRTVAPADPRDQCQADHSGTEDGSVLVIDHAAKVLKHGAGGNQKDQQCLPGRGDAQDGDEAGQRQQGQDAQHQGNRAQDAAAHDAARVHLRAGRPAPV